MQETTPFWARASPQKVKVHKIIKHSISWSKIVWVCARKSQNNRPLPKPRKKPAFAWGRGQQHSKPRKQPAFAWGRGQHRPHGRFWAPRKHAIFQLFFSSIFINTKRKAVLSSPAHSAWCFWHSITFVWLESKNWRNGSSATSPTIHKFSTVSSTVQLVVYP